MFGELLESRARRHRRAGGAALSVAAHVVIIGAATAATVRGTTTPHERPPAVFLRFPNKPVPPPKVVEPRTTVPPEMRRTATAPGPVVLRIDAPTIVPPSLPPIDLTRGSSADSIVVGSGSSSRGGPPGTTLDLTEGPSSNEWRGNEVLMHILSSAKPRYPEILRQSGVDGRVLVQFTVDTTGRVDMNSVRISKSTHELFTQAVRAALPSFRFKPAEVGGKRIAALAEMPFEFQVNR